MKIDQANTIRNFDYKKMYEELCISTPAFGKIKYKIKPAFISINIDNTIETNIPSEEKYIQDILKSTAPLEMENLNYFILDTYVFMFQLKQTDEVKLYLGFLFPRSAYLRTSLLDRSSNYILNKTKQTAEAVLV